MINSIRSGYEVQIEINELELLKLRIASLDIDDRYKLVCSEITTLINVLNWVGNVKGLPTPSVLIKKFIYDKTGIIV